MPTPLTLLTLASRQVWPQILAVLHTRPRQVVLLHSDEESESKRPAERLRDFFHAQAISNAPSVHLRRVPHDRFAEIVDTFAAVAEQWELDHTNCRVNLTGGNKLMVMAAAEWCRLAGSPCFYLERDFRVFPFQPAGTDLLPQPDFKLDRHLARELEPLALLRCQLDVAEIVSPGQRLTLNQRGQTLPEHEFPALLKKNFDFRLLLNTDQPEAEDQPGFWLEYAVAFVLLKLGIPVIQRSIRLKPRVLRGVGLEEGELDLVFNWAGKLWVVDCKDRRSAENRVDQLRTEILSQMTLTPSLDHLLLKVEDELRERDLKPLKEDLLAVSEVGGLLGRAICVRRSKLPLQATEFARSRNLPVILRENLIADLRSILFPDQPASLDQLKALAHARTKVVS